MKTRRHSLAVLFLLSGFVLAGCALTDAHVNPGYVVESGKKSPLGAIAPLALTIQVEDRRTASEQDRVGNKKNNFGAVTAKVISEKEPTAILYDALRAEFEANNHKIVKPEDRNADALLKVGLNRYWSDFAVHFFDIEMKGTLETDIALLKGVDPDPLVSKPFNSTFRESRQIALDGAFEDALKGALVEYIRSFSRDPNVLDALRSVALRKDMK